MNDTDRDLLAGAAPACSRRRSVSTSPSSSPSTPPPRRSRAAPRDRGRDRGGVARERPPADLFDRVLAEDQPPGPPLPSSAGSSPRRRWSGAGTPARGRRFPAAAAVVFRPRRLHRWVQRLRTRSAASGRDEVAEVGEASAAVPGWREESSCSSSRTCLLRRPDTTTRCGCAERGRRRDGGGRLLPRSTEMMPASSPGCPGRATTRRWTCQSSPTAAPPSTRASAWPAARFSRSRVGSTSGTSPASASRGSQTTKVAPALSARSGRRPSRGGLPRSAGRSRGRGRCRHRGGSARRRRARSGRRSTPDRSARSRGRRPRPRATPSRRARRAQAGRSSLRARPGSRCRAGS